MVVLLFGHQGDRDISGGDALLGNTRYTSRTRWLSQKRPMVLCWRRHGRAGGCRVANNNELCREAHSLIKYISTLVVTVFTVSIYRARVAHSTLKTSYRIDETNILNIQDIREN